MLEEQQFCLCPRTGQSFQGQDSVGRVLEHFQLPVLVETGVARENCGGWQSNELAWGWCLLFCHRGVSSNLKEGKEREATI